MEHIAAFLLIIGCSGDLAHCRELPAPVPVFETFEECESELPVAKNSFTGGHQRVFAECLFVDPALEEDYAELVWDITPDGKLVAELTTDVTVASNSERKRDVFLGQE
jgi:hypothetical protein